VVLNGNDVPFDVFLNSLAKNGKVYIALELANADTLENAYANHQRASTISGRTSKRKAAGLKSLRIG